MQKKTEYKVKLMQGNRFPPIQEIYLDFRSSSLPLTESNECFLNNFHVFHWKIMKMGDSSNLFKKSGFDAEKTVKHEILSTSSETRVLSNIENYL